MQDEPISDLEAARRWRLVLGGDAQDREQMSEQDRGMDKVLEALYDSDRKSGLGSAAPKVHRWLGDIRTYFPRTTVQVLQRDAMERLGLDRMLLEPEVLETVVPDVHLVATLLSLKGMIPAKTRETARMVVRKVVQEVERRLSQSLRDAVKGAVDRSTRSLRPRMREIDWDRTIRRNLKTWDPVRRILIPERIIGHGRKGRGLKHVVLCVDQSGSMATSVVYAGIFGAVLASMRALTLSMAVFDTDVADLSEHLDDPVELLFSTQLGGGTDISLALGWVQQQVVRPSDTVVVLITDLYEGGDVRQMLQRAHEIQASGATCICLLALSDDGKPGYDANNAAKMQTLGWATFACSPNAFPELMARAIEGRGFKGFSAS
ncbi:MAG: Mg-chelatase subunit ChlD [Cognaticolwellia sp.]|jgi:Mg-chelatase subunit ChlD